MVLEGLNPSLATSFAKPHSLFDESRLGLAIILKINLVIPLAAANAFVN